MKKIGIVAPSSVISNHDLSLGVALLQSWGAKVEVSPQVSLQHGIFAGSDELRANAIFEFAKRDDLEILWSARGGYGANHLLPYLEALTKKYGRPKKKTYVGYSDATALLSFCASRWGWKTIHGVMPSHKSFLKLKLPERELLKSMLGLEVKNPLRLKKEFLLTPILSAKKNQSAPLVGGNLAVWNSLTGTPFQPSVKGKWLFFEDLAENPSRLDRMVQQLSQAGGFDGCVGVILGDFTDCEDSPPVDTAGHPLRKKIPLRKALFEMFRSVGQAHGFPVYAGLPVGHGPNFFPLALGDHYRIIKTPTGRDRFQYVGE